MSMREIKDFVRRHAKKCKKNESDIFLVIKGKSGHRIEDFSQFNDRNGELPNQKEVLFDKGAKFVFDSTKQDPMDIGHFI